MRAYKDSDQPAHLFVIAGHSVGNQGYKASSCGGFICDACFSIVISNSTSSSGASGKGVGVSGVEMIGAEWDGMG